MMNFSMVVFIGAMFFGTIENATQSQAAGGAARVLAVVAGVCFMFGLVGMFAAAKH